MATKENFGTLHIKTGLDIRNQVVGRLRMSGTTMQAYLDHVLRGIAADDPRWRAWLVDLPVEPELYKPLASVK